MGLKGLQERVLDRAFIVSYMCTGMLKFCREKSAHEGNVILLFLFQIAPLVHQSCDTLSKKLETFAESGEKVDMWR